MNNAYIAGFFDGEGSVAVYKAGGKYNSFYLRIQITQNRTVQSKKIMNYLKSKYGGNLSLQETSSGNIKYNYQLNSDKAVKFLQDIKPYIILKCNQVELAIAWQKQRPKLIRNSKGQIKKTRPENIKYANYVVNKLKELKRNFV